MCRTWIRKTTYHCVKSTGRSSSHITRKTPRRRSNATSTRPRSSSTSTGSARKGAKATATRFSYFSQPCEVLWTESPTGLRPTADSLRRVVHSYVYYFSCLVAFPVIFAVQASLLQLYISLTRNHAMSIVLVIHYAKNYRYRAEWGALLLSVKYSIVRAGDS